MCPEIQRSCVWYVTHLNDTGSFWKLDMSFKIDMLSEIKVQDSNVRHAYVGGCI